MTTELLPHNKEVYDKVQAALMNTNRTCVVQPTGTGKSYVIAAVAEGYKQVLVLAPNYFVLNQAKKVIGLRDGVEFMTYAGLNVAEKVRGDYDLIVLDEFHRAGSPEWGKAVADLLSLNKQAKILGTSATPIRYLDAGRDMTQELFGGNVASQMSIGEAWAREILPVPVYVTGVFDFEKTIKTTANGIKQARSMSKEERKERLERLSKTMQDWKQSHGMAAILKKYIDKDVRRMLVFCDHIGGMRQAVRTVTEWFEQAGLKVADTYTLHSGLPDKTQERRMHNFESDDIPKRGIKLMFSVNMLNEGVHIPHVEAILMLRTTKSRIIYMQQIGRCLTAVSSERKPVVLDMADNITQTSAVHGMREDFLRWKEKNQRRKKDERDSVVFDVYDHLQELREIVERLSVDTRIFIPFAERIRMLREYCEKYGCLPMQRHVDDYQNWRILRSYHNSPELQEIVSKYPRYDKQRALRKRADEIMAFCKKNGRAPSYPAETLEERRLGQTWKDKKKYLLAFDGMKELYDKYAKRGTRNGVLKNLKEIENFCNENKRLPLREDGKIYSMWAYANSVRYLHPEIASLFARLRKKYGKARQRPLEVVLDEWERYAEEHGELPKGRSRTARNWSNIKCSHKDHPRVVALLEKYKK